MMGIPLFGCDTDCIPECDDEGGVIGPTGKSAYQVAVEAGFTGTSDEWLASLKGNPGPSAYQAAVDQGFLGSESEWLASLKGDPGPAGPVGPIGNAAWVTISAIGTGDPQVIPLTEAVPEEQTYAFVNGLLQEPGTDYVVAGTDLTITAPLNANIRIRYILGSSGGPVVSAYDLAVFHGFVGTEVEWLASLQGAAGADSTVPGPEGPQGPPGPQGEIGPQGPAGAGAAWGTMAGTLSDQTDLQTALDGKLPVTPDAAYPGGWMCQTRSITVGDNAVENTMTIGKGNSPTATGFFSLDLMNFGGGGWFGFNLTAAGRIPIQTYGSVTGWEFTENPYVNSNVIYHAGNLTFGEGLSYDPATGALTATSSGSVDDTAYSAAGWDGDTTSAPSKNAVRDKFESLPILASGTYTPTYTPVSGTTTVIASALQYQRVGNTVTISGKVAIQQSSTGAFEVDLDLPVASAFTADGQAGGTGHNDTFATTCCFRVASKTNGKLNIKGTCNQSTSLSYWFSATYRIL